MNNPVLGAKLKRYPQGNIYQLFGENVKAYSWLGLNGHNGVDVVAIEGTPILGCKGRVVDVKNDVGGYGKHIRILTIPDINGDYLEVTYGHLKDILVKVGDTIFDRQAIGTCGNTGYVISGGVSYYWGNAPAGRGVHLHFGIREYSIRPTGWQSIYHGETHYVKNYDNGFKGAVDPMKYLNTDDYAEIKNQYWFKIFVQRFLLAFK